jgi:pre-mRNA-processing factor 6
LVIVDPHGSPGKVSTEEVDRGDYGDANFDEFSGFSERLFSDTPYDREDAEADEIYESVDDRMDTRRKRQREEILKKVRSPFLM